MRGTRFIQPVESVYVIFELPAETPDTVPVPEPMVATPVVALVHVPPVGVELNVVVLPAQTDAVPVIVVGRALTGTLAVALQPAPVE